MVNFVFLFFFTLGEAENVEKFTKRLVKVTREHNDECKQLLKLMGIPYVDVNTMYKTSTIYFTHFVTKLSACFASYAASLMGCLK